MGNIIGSPEIETFGAKFAEEFEVPYMLNITEKVVPTNI